MRKNNYDELLAKVNNYINKKAYCLKEMYHFDIDDCIQEMRIAVWESSKSFNSKYGYKEITYAMASIQHKATKIIKDNYKMLENESSNFLDDEFVVDRTNIYSLIELRNIFEVVKKKLKESQYMAYKLFDLMANGYTFSRADACNCLGITEAYGYKLWHKNILPIFRRVYCS